MASHLVFDVSFMRYLNSATARRRLVSFARKHLGKPYVYGAKPSEAPRHFDCSSFTQYLYRRIGIELPRTSIEQAKVGRRVRSPALRTLGVGDLLFFTGLHGRYDHDFPQGIGHCALCLGEGKIVHAKFAGTHKRPGGRVRTDDAGRWLRRSDLVTVRRFLE